MDDLLREQPLPIECAFLHNFLKADMAIFKDDNNQRYLGVLYHKNDDIYSGNFMKISERVFNRMLALHWFFIRFILLSIAVSLCVFFYKMAFDPLGDFEDIFLVIAGIATAALVSYSLSAFLLFFSKVKIKNRKMSCITKPSIEIYLIVLLGDLSLILNGYLSGAMEARKLFIFHSFTLFPLAALCCIAIFYYSRNEKKIRSH